MDTRAEKMAKIDETVYMGSYISKQGGCDSAGSAESC